MNVKRLINTFETMMQHIKKNLMSKRKQKLKLRMILLQTKKR